MTKAWDKLLEYETRDLVERFINEKYNRDASARQILEITSNFIQGREYFLNAKRAAISVKPLLLYYGVSALSRGLILAISPHLSEAAMKPSHGLDTVNWKETLSLKNFGDLIISIKKGAFLELITATSNRTYFKHNSNSVSWNIDFNIPKIDTKIRFEDLVQTISDLSEEYKTWKKAKLSFLRLEKFKHVDISNEYEYIIHRDKNSDEEIFKIFPKELFGEFYLNEVNKKVTIRSTQKYIPQFSQRFFDSFNMGMGEIVITKAIENELHLNTLGQLFSLSFYLGMLARYFPSIWISLARTEKGDAIYPLFIRAIDLIEKHYPTIVVEFLNRPYDFENKNSS